MHVARSQAVIEAFFLGRWTMVMDLLNKAGGTAEQYRMLNSGEAFDNSGKWNFASGADAESSPSRGGGHPPHG